MRLLMRLLMGLLMRSLLKLLMRLLMRLLLGGWIPFFLATSLSTIRELVKDGADLDGDAIFNLQTFPRKFGLVATLWLLRILTLCLCFGAALPWFEGWYGIYYFILLIAGVAMPSLFAVFIILNESSTNEDYIKTTRIFKGSTIGGMIVILSTGF